MEDDRKIYANAADGVIKLQEKLGWYEQDRISIYNEYWDKLNNIDGSTFIRRNAEIVRCS